MTRGPPPIDPDNEEFVIFIRPTSGVSPAILAKHAPMHAHAKLALLFIKHKTLTRGVYCCPAAHPAVDECVSGQGREPSQHASSSHAAERVGQGPVLQNPHKQHRPITLQGTPLALETEPTCSSTEIQELSAASRGLQQHQKQQKRDGWQKHLPGAGSSQ